MPSFDVVSRTDMAEVDNAVNGAAREIATRYDFKGSNCSYERSDETITLKADDDYKLKAMQELLRGYMVRRKVEVGALEFGKAETASGDTLRQVVTIKQGIERELAQQIVKAIKNWPSRSSRRSRAPRPRCRRRSRATSCAFPARSATICRRPWS